MVKSSWKRTSLLAGWMLTSTPEGVHLEEEDGDGVAALHEGVVVALEEAEVERAVFDRALVDEEDFLGARGAADAGLADEAAQAQLAGAGRRWGR